MNNSTLGEDQGVQDATPLLTIETICPYSQGDIRTCCDDNSEIYEAKKTALPGYPFHDDYHHEEVERASVYNQEPDLTAPMQESVLFTSPHFSTTSTE